jgi:SAM-dependent methyltransferase
MLQSGSRHVILLELSHAVDDVILRNLRPSGFRNFDVVQCSIDAPPLRSRSIDGIVICHNVIQHTPSVERTATALYDLVAPGGEFVFNCYPTNDETPFRWLRFHGVYEPLRAVLSRVPFGVRLRYARAMAAARLVPGLGTLLEKSMITFQGDVPVVAGEGRLSRLRRRYRVTALNTFDWYGGHAYQHHKSEKELRALVAALQPDPERILNIEAYFTRPAPIGAALRVRR